MAKICSKTCLSKVINRIFQICLVIFLAVLESVVIRLLAERRSTSEKYWRSTSGPETKNILFS